MLGKAVEENLGDIGPRSLCKKIKIGRDRFAIYPSELKLGCRRGELRSSGGERCESVGGSTRRHGDGSDGWGHGESMQILKSCKRGEADLRPVRMKCEGAFGAGLRRGDFWLIWEISRPAAGWHRGCCAAVEGS